MDKKTDIGTQNQGAVEPESLLGDIKAARPEDAQSYFTQVLNRPDNRQKADLLAACGDLFQKLFLRTRTESLCNDTINAYELALDLVPPTDSEYLIFLQDVASWHLIRFNQLRDFTDLDRAIDGLEDVVSGTHDTHRGMPIWLNNLAIALNTRFKRLGNEEDIDRAISVQRKVLSLTLNEDPALPIRLNNFSNLLQTRYEQTGKAEDTDEAMSVIQECFKVIPEGHQNMQECLNTRGSNFRLRHERSPNAAAINEAIKLYEQAVDLRPVRDRRILASSLENLGRSYHHRFNLEGKVEDIDIAIATQRRGIDVSPTNHPDLHRWLTRISDSFLLRFQRIGNLQDLHSSIKTQQEAINAIPASDQQAFAAYLKNLAGLFFYRFDRTGSLADINQAILEEQRAISLITSADKAYSSHLRNLGDYLLTRFERTEDPDDIEDAIAAQKKAVELTQGTDVWTLQSLATSLLSRSQHAMKYSDLEEGISCLRKAADLSVSGNARADRHLILNNLGSALLNSIGYKESKTDISEAIGILQKAIEIAPTGHIYIPNYMVNLGICLCIRYEQTGNEKDIESAISVHEKAINLTDQDSADVCFCLMSLGKDFAARYERKQDLVDLEEAIDKCRQAALSPTGPPWRRLDASRRWAVYCVKIDPVRAMDAFSTSFQLQTRVAGLEQTIDARYARLVQTKSLPTTAAAVAIKNEQYERAVEWLEQGRCLVWNQVNSLRTPVDELRTYDEGLAEDVVRVSRALETAGSRDYGYLPVITEDTKYMAERISEQAKVISHLELAEEWDRLLDRVRDIPRFKDFLRPPRCSDLLRDLPPSGIVVMINAHKDTLKMFDSCDALALVHGSSGPRRIPLKGFSYEQAEVLRRNLQGRLRGHGLRLREADPETERGMRREAEAGLDLSIRDILRELWIGIGKPVLEALKIPCRPWNPRRIWWCLTGPLASLPIHAAGNYGDETETGSIISDYVISSYIPTLSTLIERVKQPRKINRETEGLFVVSQPNTPDLPPIPGTSKEARAIEDRVKDKVSRVLCLEGKEVTIARALEEMQSHSCVHLACHAIQQEDSPLESGFHLEDGRLELSEIMKKDIRSADLAFLSACQTSTGNDFFSEEAVHLAAGMLAVGYRGVVATMWSIRDRYGCAVADYFYDHLMGCEKREVSSDAAACALHYATKRLWQDMDGSETSFLTWVPYIHMGV